MLDHKKWVKKFNIANAFYEKEIHRVDISPFNEDYKNIIFFGQGGLNFGKGTAEKLGKMAKNKEACCYGN